MQFVLYCALSMLLFGVIGGVHAADFYVSVTGSDTNSGTKARPFRSPAAGQNAARVARATHPDVPVTVYFAAGTYYLPATLTFTAADSGSAQAPVTYAALPGAEVTWSGGQRLELKWNPYQNGIFQALLPSHFQTDQLFVNGARQILARYPNFDARQPIFNGYAADAISPERAKRWADPTGGFLHAMHGSLWGGMSYRITGKNSQGEVMLEGGWQNNRPAPMHPEYRFVENIFEELDAPGEWFDNVKTGTLYFYPPAGLDLDHAVIEGVRLHHIVDFQGSEQSPVRFVTLRGIVFRHAARTFMENKEPLLRTDWTTYRGGAVFFNGAEDCSLLDCFLDQVGGNAVFVNDYNRRITVRGCHIFRASANGVAFVGDTAAVRNGIGWSAQNDFQTIDRTPGPKSSNYPADCIVDDCLIHETGRTEKQTAGIEIDIAQNITARHCSIYDVPRAGINIGDGAWGGHIIEDCDVFDTVKETGDHGSFNSWGRDRFWNLRNVDLNSVTLGPDKDLPLLDVVRPITILHNRWRCDHGWDIDLDDGSSNYVIRDNLCLNGGLKNREGFFRVVENNIMVNNSFHPHVWFGNSQDVFRRNIVFTPYRPIGMHAPWGKEIDKNLLYEAGVAPAPATQLQALSGRDQNSIVADARFVGPATGDFRVLPGSPALALGFVNFAMDNFGVLKPALRAIARTPEFSAPSPPHSAVASKRDGAAVKWLGATIKNVVGLGEVSAAGLSGEIGVWVETVPTASAAAIAGLKETDVILRANGKPVVTVRDLLKIWNAAAAGGTVRLDLWRAQKPFVLEIKAPAKP
jgi:hypothetical protein